MQVTSKPAKKKLNRKRKQPLDVFFSPRTVAVIGATENPGTVGRTVLWNLVTSPFGGTVYPVNPKRPSVLGVKAYPSVSEIPEPVDLSVIITPPPSIPGLIRECGENGVLVLEPRNDTWWKYRTFAPVSCVGGAPASAVSSRLP